MGKQWKQCQTLFWGASKSLQMVTAAMKLCKMLAEIIVHSKVLALHQEVHGLYNYLP